MVFTLICVPWILLQCCFEKGTCYIINVDAFL